MNPFAWSNAWNNELADTMRSTMEKTTNTMIAMKGTWETMLGAMNDQAAINQKQGQDIFNDWMGMMRRGQQTCQKIFESSMDKYVSGFRGPGKDAHAGTPA